MISLVVLLTLGAGDEQRELCRSAYEQGQELRAQGQFLAARRKFAVCAVGRCPEFIRRDCAVWSTEVANEQPTMLVVARTEGGRDTLVRVWVDDVLVSDSGSVPLEVDPGEHRLRFEADGSRSVEQRLVFRVGEKRKYVTVTLPPLEVAAPQPTLVPRETQPPPVAVISPSVTKTSPLRVTGFITAGAAVASAIVGASVTVYGLEHERTLSTSCAPFCTTQLVGPIRTEYAIADTMLIVAGALALAAVVQLFVSFVASD